MTKEQKEKASKIWGDVKDGLEKGYNASKKGLKKAGVAIQKFSDKSVVAVEKKQLESKRKKLYATIGELAVSKLSAKTPKPITTADEEISPLLKDVAKLDKEIAKYAKTLKEFDGKAGKAAPKTAKKPTAKK